MPLLKQRSQIAVKAETNEGTAETLAASNAFLVFDPASDPVVDQHQRDPLRSTLSQLEPLAGARSGKISFVCELVGSGTRGVAPHWGEAMKACGFAESISTGTSVTYVPASSSIQVITAAHYMDGMIHKIWGARGNVKLTLEKGKPGLLHFEFTGADFSVTDGSLLSGVTYNSTKPPVFLGATFSFDSYSACIAKLEMDMGNALALRECVNMSSGHVSALITNRNPKVTFDPEMVLVATKDFFGMLRGDTGVAMAATLGSATGNTIALSAPKCKVDEIKFGDRTGIVVGNVSALMAMNTGDDEFQIVIT